jgi:hypothetical protein
MAVGENEINLLRRILGGCKQEKNETHCTAFIVHLVTAAESGRIERSCV